MTIAKKEFDERCYYSSIPPERSVAMKTQATFAKPAIQGLPEIIPPELDANFMPSGIMRFDAWGNGMGIGRTTRYKWVKLGFIKVDRISGIPYVRRAAVLEFLRRCQAGEFADMA
jgi:hypothetical protein